MLIKDIYAYLDTLSPFELQEKWDNSGLIVGNKNDKIDNIYISLDLDLNMIKDIKPNSLIITHHPLIFTPLKKINNNTYATKILKHLIQKDIALISMHTNIDKTHLNMYVGRNILGFDCIQDKDFIVTAKVNMSFKKLRKHIKNKLNIKLFKTVKSHKLIQNISLTTGSGMSLLPYIKTDCFLTGDIKYHEAMEAIARDITLFDIGHYESEVHFSTLIKSLIKSYLKNNDKSAIILASRNPFN